MRCLFVLHFSLYEGQKNYSRHSYIKVVKETRKFFRPIFVSSTFTRTMSSSQGDAYKTAAFAIFLVTIVIIASFAGVVLSRCSGPTGRRHQVPAAYTKVERVERVERERGRERERERFVDEFRTIKNDEYGSYLKPFFSSGDTEHEIAFVPSVTDVACVTMTDDITSYIGCDKARLDTLSVKDDRSVHLPGNDTCNSMLASKQPSNTTDADVRIMTGMYRFYKSCVILNFHQLSTKSDDGGEALTMKMSSVDPSTMFLLMNRPVFLATDSSSLYSVEYPVGESIKMYRGLDAKTHREVEGSPQLIDIVLRKVENAKMHDIKNTKSLQDIFGDYDDDVENDRGVRRMMHATVFYLKYQTPLRVGSVQMKFDLQEAVTLVFPVTTGALKKNNSKWFNSKQSSSPRIRVESSPTGNDGKSGTVSVKLGEPNKSETHTLEVFDRGYVVVIYTTDKLILCYMNRERVVFRTVEGVPALNIDDPTLFQVNVEGAGAQVPPLCFPTTTYSIGNLYDMYVRLVSFS